MPQRKDYLIIIFINVFAAVISLTKDCNYLINRPIVNPNVSYISKATRVLWTYSTNPLKK